MFFAERDKAKTKEALEVCKHCPVRKECFKYAMDNQEGYGVWGGTSQIDRRRLIGAKLGVKDWRP